MSEVPRLSVFISGQPDRPARSTNMMKMHWLGDLV